MTYDNWKTTPPDLESWDCPEDRDPYWLCCRCGHKTYKDEIARKGPGVGVVCLPCAEEESGPTA